MIPLRPDQPRVVGELVSEVQTSDSEIGSNTKSTDGGTDAVAFQKHAPPKAPPVPEVHEDQWSSQDTAGRHCFPDAGVAPPCNPEVRW
jgi:hypothetical protein